MESWARALLGSRLLSHVSLGLKAAFSLAVWLNRVSIGPSSISFSFLSVGEIMAFQKIVYASLLGYERYYLVIIVSHTASAPKKALCCPIQKVSEIVTTNLVEWEDDFNSLGGSMKPRLYVAVISSKNDFCSSWKNFCRESANQSRKILALNVVLLTRIRFDSIWRIRDEIVPLALRYRSSII